EFAAPPSPARSSAAARPAPSTRRSFARRCGFARALAATHFPCLLVLPAPPALAPRSLPPSSFEATPTVPSGKSGNPPRTPPASKYKSSASPRSRSEERRVGKECRSRWGPDHEKKKENRTASKNKCPHESTYAQ